MTTCDYYRLLGAAVRVSGEVIDSVTEVDVVDVLATALECPVLVAHGYPLGLGRCVRSQFEHVQHTSELVACHGAVVCLVEVFEQREQLDLRVLHLQCRQSTQRSLD